MNKYLEMRSICLIEPETEEFVQVNVSCVDVYTTQ